METKKIKEEIKSIKGTTLGEIKIKSVLRGVVILLDEGLLDADFANEDDIITCIKDNKDFILGQKVPGQK